MTINVFLDTEFTSLEPDAKLISIALITEDGQRQLYAELTGLYDEQDCSEFVITDVLPLLDAPELPEKVDYRNVNARMSLSELQQHLHSWFSALIDPVYVWSDSVQHDWRYVEQVFTGIGFPYNLLPVPQAIDPRNAGYRNKTEGEFSKSNIRQHHAMDDVKVIRLGWIAAK